MLETPFQLALVAASLPGGALADRFGRKLVLFAGGAGWAVGVRLFGIGPTLIWVLLAQLLLGISCALSDAPDNAFLHDSLDALGRGTEFTSVVGRGRACMLGAFLLSSLAGSPLAAATTLQFPILCSAGLGLLATLLVLGFREPPRQHAAQHLPYVQILRQATVYITAKPHLLWLMLLQALLLACGSISFIFLQPVVSAHAVPVAAFGAVTAAVQGLSILGSLTVERLRRRFGERLLFALTAAAMIAALLVIGAVSSLAGLLGFALLSFSFALVGPLASTYVNGHSPDALRATLQTMLSISAGLVSAGAAPLLGLLADHLSLPLIFLISAGGGGLLTLLTLLAGLTATARLLRQV